MTHDPDTPQELGRLRQALFLGLARQPLAVPEGMQALLATAPAKDPTLAVLALAGQRQRFQRPVVERSGESIPDVARRLHDDRRPILPERARRLLLRLANGVDKSLADAAVRAAVGRVMRAGFRLHPFDLPRLITHIKEHAKCLGLAERAYLALADGSSKSETPGLIHAEITAETWTEFPKAHRVAFLRAERRSDPAAALALLEGVFKSEPAAVRSDLLAALDVGLGADDLPFLESLSTDRSENVRKLAARLSASVPGTPAYAARLAEAARCFTRTGGVLRRVGLASSARVVFTPPNLATWRAMFGSSYVGLLGDLFEGFSVTEIATAASLGVDEIVGALPAGEETIMTALSNRVVRDGDEEAMLRLAAHRLSHMDAERVSAAPLLCWLADNLTAPVSGEFGKTLLGSAAWQATLERLKEATTPAGMKDDGTLIWTAALLPPELLGTFEEAMNGLLPISTRSARDFLDLTRALDTLEPPQR